MSSININEFDIGFCYPLSVQYKFSYILRELFSGMNYIITMRAGNIIGDSSLVMILGETDPTTSNLHDKYDWFNVNNN